MGLEYLMARQGENGSLVEDYGGGGRYMYPHLIALTAMVEGVALTSDVQTVGGCQGASSATCNLDLDALKNATQKAIDFAITAAVPVDSSWSDPLVMKGGWSYFANGVESGDLSHHLWGVSSFLTAKRQGLTVPDSAIEMLSAFLDSTELEPRITDQGVTLGDYRYRTSIVGPPYNTATVSMTASGLLCRTLLGAPASHPKIDQFADTISPWEGEMYYNLHATQLMHRVGGSRWDTWRTAMDSQLLAAQEQSGHLRGSFFWPSSTMDIRVAAEWNPQGGRLYCTVFALLSLEQNFSRLKLSKVGQE